MNTTTYTYKALQIAILCFISIIFIGCSTADNTSELHQIFEDFWEYRLETEPFLATSHGIRSANSKLPDVSLEALTARNEQMLAFKNRLSQIDQSNLSQQDFVSYRLLDRTLSNSIEAFELGEYVLPLNGWWDYHATIAELPTNMPFNNTEDYENYLSRLQAFPQMNTSYLERLSMGVERGWVRPKVVLDNYIPTVENLITEVEESRFFEPFKSFPQSVTIAERERLQEKALQIITDSIIPEYEILATYLKNDYYNAAPEITGVSEWQGGLEYYEYLVRNFTTTDTTPQEIHQIGLNEVERIRGEMQQVILETGFTRDFDEFVHFLRTDSRFYAQTKDELLKYTSLILKKMDGELPKYFGRLPRMPYGIREIPDYLAPRMTTASYSSPAQDGTRAGFYNINTYDLPSRPLYEVEALSYHEAVPGHHLQLALQQELEGIPTFRQNSSFTVFVEGWALYSEWLALEMGFYEDPYNNFGRLSYEMWRALRLVVDTGLHAKGWTRQQAIDFMAENSALTLLNIRNEVDRYIFWPGQALAYKTGELKIRELRSIAEQELGDTFDIRSFHDAVLENGSVTLEVLEEHILNWIENQR